MTKFVIILVSAAIIESIGVALLGWGLKDIQGVREVSVSEIVRVIKSGATNMKIVSGIAFEAVFFGALLYMMSTNAVSFVWPLNFCCTKPSRPLVGPVCCSLPSGRP